MIHLQVALNTFIDNVSVLAIENCLIGKVSELFKSSKILKLSHEEISRLAGETAESSVERKRLLEKHEILNAGLQDLKSLSKQGQFSRRTGCDSEDAESKVEKSAFGSENVSTANSVRGGSFVISLQDKASPVVDEDF